MPNFHELRVKNLIRETSQAVSIAFDVPSELKDEFRFTAGQYLTIKYEQDGEKIRRSYSICSSPESGELKVTVKEVEGGQFSAWANNKLQEGDTLNVFPPEGKFTFSSDSTESHHNYAAFAAGSGITPVMAILKSVLENEPHSKFVLVYGNKSPEQTIFFKELLELQVKHAERLFVEFVYSKAKEDQSFFGRIERSTVNFVLKNKFKGHQFNAFYLCGPEPMIDLVSEVLQENKIDKAKIFFELFTSTEEAEIEADVSGKTQVTVMLDDEETTFEMDRKTRVLDAVLEKDLDPPYSCQGGICSSCLAQIKEGKAKMANNQILTDEEVEEGLILTCQAHPTTPKLRIDYDDV